MRQTGCTDQGGPATANEKGPISRRTEKDAEVEKCRRADGFPKKATRTLTGPFSLKYRCFHFSERCFMNTF